MTRLRHILYEALFAAAVFAATIAPVCHALTHAHAATDSQDGPNCWICQTFSSLDTSPEAPSLGVSASGVPTLPVFVVTNRPLPAPGVARAPPLDLS